MQNGYNADSPSAKTRFISLLQNSSRPDAKRGNNLISGLLRPFSIETTDRHCIKDNTTIYMVRGTGGIPAFSLQG